MTRVHNLIIEKGGEKTEEVEEEEECLLLLLLLLLWKGIVEPWGCKVFILFYELGH